MLLHDPLQAAPKPGRSSAAVSRFTLRLPAFLKGAFFLTLAMLLSRGAVVLASALVANAFGAEAFALFTFVHLTATALANTAMLGMMNGLPRFVAKMDVDGSPDALTQVLISMTVVMIGLVVAAAIVGFLPVEVIGLPDATRKPILIALIFGIGLTNVLNGASNGLERFLWVTVSSFALGLVLLAGTFAAATAEASEWPLRIYLIATVASILIMLPGIARPIVGRIAAHGVTINRENLRAVGIYVGPMLFVTLMTSTGAWIAGRMLLEQPDGLQAYAQFALGFQWFGLAAMSANVISRTVMPRFTRNIWFNDFADQRKTLRSAIFFSVMGALGVLLVTAVAFPLVIRFYGAELSDAFWPMMLFIAAAVVSAPVSILTSALITETRYGLVIGSTFLWWIVTVAGAYITADKGPVPVILCTLIGYAMQTIVLLYLRKSASSSTEDKEDLNTPNADA